MGGGAGAFTLGFLWTGCWAFRVRDSCSLMLELLAIALTRPGMFEGYTQDGGRDMVGEGDLCCPASFCFSNTYFSILDWRLANSSAPFPEALERVCSSLCSTLARVLELLRVEDHSGSATALNFTSSLARKLEASAPKARSSSSEAGSGTALGPCFFLSSAPWTRDSSSGLGATTVFSLNVNMDFLVPRLTAPSSRMPVLIWTCGFHSAEGFGTKVEGRGAVGGAYWVTEGLGETY